MDSLDTFIEELLMDEGNREGLLNDMISHLKEQAIPSLEQLKTGYTDNTQLHGVYYDYDKKEVTISYRVVPDLHPDRVMSFSNFQVILEGLLVCRRHKRWELNHL